MSSILGSLWPSAPAPAPAQKPLLQPEFSIEELDGMVDSAVALNQVPTQFLRVLPIKVYDVNWAAFGEVHPNVSLTQPQQFYVESNLPFFYNAVTQHNEQLQKNPKFNGKNFAVSGEKVIALGKGDSKQHFMVGAYNKLHTQQFDINDHGDVCPRTPSNGVLAPFYPHDKPYLNALLFVLCKRQYDTGAKSKTKLADGILTYITVNKLHIAQPYASYFAAHYPLLPAAASGPQAAPPPIDTAVHAHASDDISDDEVRTPPGTTSMEWKKQMLSTAKKAEAERLAAEKRANDSEKKRDVAEETNAKLAGAADKHADAAVMREESERIRVQSEADSKDRLTSVVERMQKQNEKKDDTIATQNNTIATQNNTIATLVGSGPDKKPSPALKKPSPSLNGAEVDSDSSGSGSDDDSKVTSTPSTRGKRPKPPLHPSRSGTPKPKQPVPPASRRRTPKKQTPRGAPGSATDGSTGTPGSRRGTKRSGTSQPSSNSKRRALPSVGVEVRTSTGLTGTVDASTNPKARTRVTVALDVGGLQTFNVDDLQWD